MHPIGSRVNGNAICKGIEKGEWQYRTPHSVKEVGEVVAFSNGRIIRQSVRDGTERLVKVMVRAHGRVSRSMDVLCPKKA
mgnify:CR=1 FL=1